MQRTLELVRTPIHFSACTSDLSHVKDFYCTLPMSAGQTISRFPASEGTTFDTLTDVIYASLSYPDSKPSFTFRLSTDPENAPWERLDSPDDWDHTISRVREKKTQQRGKVRRSVDVQIGIIQSAV